MAVQSNSSMAEKKRKRYAYVKRRIAKAHACAKAVGVLYLLGIIAVSALALMPLLVLQGVDFSLGVATFWTPFLSVADIWNNLLPVTIAGLYSIMLLVLLINIFRAISKLGWLFKRKASKLYGFNRNMYAMDDLGKIFSSSFSAVVTVHLAIAALCGALVVEGIFAYVLLGVGVGIHFVCGIIGGNVSLFSTDDGIYEEKRQVDMLLPVIRNIIQIAGSAAIFWFFIANNTMVTGLFDVLKASGADAFADFMPLLSPIAQLVALIAIMSLTARSLDTVEFDMEGAEASGRGLFTLLAFISFIVLGGIYVLEYMAFIPAALTAEMLNSYLIMAGIALALVVIELILFKFPRISSEAKYEEDDADDYIKEREETPVAAPAPAPAPAPVPSVQPVLQPIEMPYTPNTQK